jgi:hypothetical protein
MTLEPRNSSWSSEIAWAFDLGMPAVGCSCPSVYESHGKLQTQILCDADDNPRDRMNTGRYG